MAQKQYMDLNAIKHYDAKIKALIDEKDAAALAAAKAYSNDLADNYDAAGTAQTKVDELANGQVKTNTEAIVTLNGDATTAGSVAKAVADAKTVIDGDIDAVEAKADAAKDAADAAQGDVDTLEGKVGTVPDGQTVMGIIQNIQENAYDDTEVKGLIQDNTDAIDAIEADYLKAADKTALQDQITANAGAIDAIEKDYLKASDKTELQGKIDAKADQTALDAEKERAEGVEANLQTQINTIMNNPDAEGAINSINEFTQYITDHGEIAEGFRTDINKNKDDIAAMDTAYKAADTALDNRVKTLEAIDHDAYVAADTALKNELNTEIAKKANQTTVDDLDAAYKAADTALDTRLKAVEGAIGESGSVTEDIATAKSEAVSEATAAAATDATTKANQALTDAKAYTDTEVDKVEATATQNASDITALAGRVTTAEGEIDAIQTALGTTTDVTAAIADAKAAGTTAQGEVDALEGTVSTLSGKVTTNEGNISAQGDRITALEEKVGDGFVAIQNSEIDAMFTTTA